MKQPLTTPAAAAPAAEKAGSLLEATFLDVYTKFKLHFYQQICGRFEHREATLTTVEAFCMEGIMALKSPTVAEFAKTMGLSTANAASKVKSLMAKGYVTKVQSTEDKREYHLEVTPKYIEYFNISYSYLHTVVQRANERFCPEDVEKLQEMLSIISRELMPEMEWDTNR